ncbi:MAG: double-strand break repair protein AddB [Rhodobacteraceae bacterium]|nr:double-strand break repair protein AddB [Paracoccaceae bacterium]
MFEATPRPRLFGLPPGADFPRALADGLIHRLGDAPPEAMARVHLIVNTRRMARRLRDLFDAGPARLLPRISLITDLQPPVPLPPPVPPLRRRLQLTQLIARLLDRQPELAPRAALYDLALSLADLLDEMQGEGVPPDTIAGLDVSDQSGHWARAQSFIRIAQSFFEADDSAMDPQARQRRIAGMLVREWAQRPPADPVILAGSTGSRGTTQLVMQAVAALPQGAVVLPGYDFDQPGAVWDHLDDAMTAEDHPQFRFRKLMHLMQIGPRDVALWHPAAVPSQARNKVVSLALRPAPVTDAWLREGPALGDLRAAMAGVTLVEAPTPRAEALAIAMRLREAAETGQRAALITPDRMLTRQVAAALDRWDIVPDDSAGLPLHLSPPGRFLRHLASLMGKRLTCDTLLTLLKHPLTHDGAGRGDHLRHTRDLELSLRRHGPAFPDRASMAAYAADCRDPQAAAWARWVAETVCVPFETDNRPLSEWMDTLYDRARAVSAGPDADEGGLWDKAAGQAALAAVQALRRESVHAGSLSPRDFADLLGAVLAGEEIRDRDAPHPCISIWGTLEARVQGADLLILGGLNEGVWPEAARPDPWLNRALRHQAGLLLPERRIGLSAHDFQQAAAAPEVWLSRAVRSEDAETIAARWVNRLTNLLGGLPAGGGPDALKDMRRRGRDWLDRAQALEHAPALTPARRPSPRPPAEARPRRLSVTEIKTLIRDPYAIYARHVLRLRPLDPLVKDPDPLLRGIVVHGILEDFVRAVRDAELPLARDALMAVARDRIEAEVPWPTARLMWIARLEKVADWFVSTEALRMSRATPVGFEVKARAELADSGFVLTGTADRIDRDPNGDLHIYDYKTGAVPTTGQQIAFDKQLLLEAAIAEQGGFENLPAAPVARAVFVGLSGTPAEVDAPLVKTPVAQIWAEFHALILAFADPGQGFTARRMLEKETDRGVYDHLARFGEWDATDDPTPEDMT